MSPKEQIKKALRKLVARDFPIYLGEYKVEFYPNAEEEYFADDLPEPSWWVSNEVLRGFVEAEIEKRGLWGKYQFELSLAVSTGSANAVLQRRPTLLEVLTAAVEVTG